jgi:hypothetical protein
MFVLVAAVVVAVEDWDNFHNVDLVLVAFLVTNFDYIEVECKHF